jgi:glucan 1,3-beta-glucosidase
MLGDWLRSIAWLEVASLSPILGVVALVWSARPPAFAQILTRNSQPGCSRIQKSLGVLLIALAVLSAQAALSLVFDPRYRDFPFAPLTAAVLPFVFLADWKLRPKAPAAETVMAITLFVSAIYIILNEGFANWQACWLGAGLIALAFTLLQAPDAPS